MWKRLGGHLLAMGIMSPFYQEQLELAVCAYAEGRRARAAIRKSGETYESLSYPDGDGEPVVAMIRVRPEVAMRNDADRRLASALAQLGASPTSLARLSVGGGGGENDPLMDE
jgi:P27 family predicted phage terminase small subunit